MVVLDDFIESESKLTFFKDEETYICPRHGLEFSKKIKSREEFKEEQKRLLKEECRYPKCPYSTFCPITKFRELIVDG